MNVQKRTVDVTYQTVKLKCRTKGRKNWTQSCVWEEIRGRATFAGSGGQRAFAPSFPPPVTKRQGRGLRHSGHAEVTTASLGPSQAPNVTLAFAPLPPTPPGAAAEPRPGPHLCPLAPCRGPRGSRASGELL